MKNNSQFLRSFQHIFQIEKSEIDLPCHEYMFKYVLMHGSCLLQKRFLQKIGYDNRTFQVTYIFNDLAESTDEKIIEELQKLGVTIEMPLKK